MAVRTEERISRMLVYVRAATSCFVYLPLFKGGSLAHPWIAAAAAVSASGEAVWFWWRVRRTGTLGDRLLVAVDVLFCLTLMLFGTRSAMPHLRNGVATELIPTVLGSAAIVGFGFGFGRAQAAAVAVLGVGWAFAVAPDVTLKLPSDLLGLALWYVVASLSMREFRMLARRTDQAQDEAERHAVEAEAARRREEVHLEIHDGMLPIIRRVIAGEPSSDRLIRDAKLAERGARRLIDDPRTTSAEAVDGHDFSSRIYEVADTCAGTLVLEPVLIVTAEPQSGLAEVLCAATGEALRNAARHAGVRCQVHLYVESSAERGVIVVRDRGPGFELASVVPGGGFTGTFGALQRYGAQWAIESAPGRGTTVTFRWVPAEVAAGVRDAGTR